MRGFKDELWGSTNDPKYLSGELVGATKGKIVVKNKDGIIFQVDKDDPRYLSGELVGKNKGKISVIDIDGKTSQVDINDPRYLSGMLVSVINKISVYNKQNELIRVYPNDKRILSGHLIKRDKRRIYVEDNNGIKYRIHIDNPKYISGELKKITGNKYRKK